VQAVGGKDLLIDKITVRTLECDWINVDFHRVPLNTENSNDMNLTSSASLTGANVTLFGKTYIQATDDIPLISGGEILFYVKDPGYIGARLLMVCCMARRARPLWRPLRRC